MNKEEIHNKWKPILDKINVEEENKRQWMSEYTEMMSMLEIDKNNDQPISTDNWCVGMSGDSSMENLLPVAMKIAAKTIGMDIVSVNPMTSPSLGGVPELNEEKYVNERRKLILDDIFNEEEIDFDKKDDETDFKKLEDIKKDFMEGGGLFFVDYIFGSSGNSQ